MDDTRIAADSFVLGASAPPAAPPAGYVPPPPPPHASSGRSFRIAAGVLAGLVGAAAGFWAMTQLMGGGYDYPEQIGGVDFLEAGDASELIPWAQGRDMEIEVGLYGSAMSPEYMLVVIQIPEGENIDMLWSGISAASDDPSDAQTMGPDGPARFACGPNPQLPSSGSCVWIEGDLLVELDAPNLTTAELRPTAKQVFLETFDS